MVNKIEFGENTKIIDCSKLTLEELDIELHKGYNEMQNNKTINAADVFSEIKKDYKF